MPIKNTTRSIRDCARYIESARRRYRLLQSQQTIACHCCGLTLRISVPLEHIPEELICNECLDYLPEFDQSPIEDEQELELTALFEVA